MSAMSPDSKLQSDATLIRILEELLERDENITARAVARLHPEIGHASTITRSSGRAELLAQYQAKQKEIRNHLGRQTKRSKEKVAAELTAKNLRIAELERQVDILRASHLAMIRAVGELGGMSKWMKFFENYGAVRSELNKLNAIPVADIEQISVFHEN